MMRLLLVPALGAVLLAGCVRGADATPEATCDRLAAEWEDGSWWDKDGMSEWLDDDSTDPQLIYGGGPEQEPLSLVLDLAHADMLSTMMDALGCEK